MYTFYNKCYITFVVHRWIGLRVKNNTMIVNLDPHAALPLITNVRIADQCGGGGGGGGGGMDEFSTTGKQNVFCHPLRKHQLPKTSPFPSPPDKCKLCRCFERGGGGGRGAQT